MEEMTVLSAEMFDAAQTICDLDEAFEQLEKYSYYHRSLENVLRKFCDFEDIVPELTKALRPWFPNIKAGDVEYWLKNGISRKETAFKLSRALHLDLMPDDPDLDGGKLHNTDTFLKMTVSEGFHWRRPQDIVWAYAACHDYSFEQTTALEKKVEALGSLPAPSQSLDQLAYTFDMEPVLHHILSGSEEELLNWLTDEWGNLGELHNSAYMVCMKLFNTLENPAGESEEAREVHREKIKAELDSYNKALKADFKRIDAAFKRTEEEARRQGKRVSPESVAKYNQLREKYSHIHPKLSDLRFRSFLEDHYPDCKYLFSSVDQLLFDNLYRRIIPYTRRNEKQGDGAVAAAPQENRPAPDSWDMWEIEAEEEARRYEKRYAPQAAAFSVLQKIIKENWPESTVFSKIKRRELDVNRKLLLLLFLVTNGVGSMYQSKEAPSVIESFTKNEVFREKHMRCQQMLAELGFGGLDPRNPFDWLILFCLSTDDSSEDYDRMAEMLWRVFPMT